MPEGQAVQEMFAGISRRYDRANHLLSGGVDFYWRRRLTAIVAKEHPNTLYDLATGSGDVAFALAKRLPEDATITGMDFCEPMLEEARRKAKVLDPATQQRLDFRTGDCLNLPIKTDSADALTISFGYRNLEDRAKGLAEMRRVLRPGGWLHILEFSQPARWFRPFYYAYLKYVLPLFATLVTGKKDAYDYLAGTIESFPPREAIQGELEAAGFTHVSALPLTFGIVAIHSARA